MNGLDEVAGSGDGLDGSAALSGPIEERGALTVTLLGFRWCVRFGTGLLLYVGGIALACYKEPPQTAASPQVVGQRAASAAWRKVPVVPSKQHPVVGDTVTFSAMVATGDVEGEHSFSCAPVWNSLDPERGRFLHDAPDGRLVILAPGRLTVVATCKFQGITTQGVATLEVVGKP